jgi:agmatine deiminase
LTAETLPGLSRRQRSTPPTGAAGKVALKLREGPTMTIPAAHGFAMPAEWEPHARCWMAWPCRREVWGDRLEAAEKAYAEIARIVAEFEPVTMVCNPGDATEASLACGRGVEILPLEIDDSWTRDTGPTFLVDRRGGLGAVNWRFNAWGGVYRNYRHDADLGRRIADRTGARRFDAPFVMEGGALHTDGEGTLLVTEECLLNANRNPNLTKAEVEAGLRDYLGVTKVIWLAGGLEDDMTDGHVDNVACFVRPGMVLALSEDDPSDGNYATLEENIDCLADETDAAGRQLRVVRIPQPKRRDHKGRRLALSYVNFYLANGAVIMPAFEAAQDDRAYRILREIFPRRKVVQTDVTDILVGGGGIHCITQQQPAV